MKTTHVSDCEPGEPDARAAWTRTRRRLERGRGRASGAPGRPRLRAFDVAVRCTDVALRTLGLYERGHRNALDLQLVRYEHRFPDLPAALDGYRVLHLSDLHLDGMLEVVDRACALVRDEPVDLAVYTGDYREGYRGPCPEALAALQQIMTAVDSRAGHVGVLGNHDGSEMVAPLEALGLRLLLNESIVLARGDARVVIAGTDDPHDYPAAADADLLQRVGARVGPGDFYLALIHSAELYDAAAAAGVDLYLCGHTHGGQIATPRGRPLITHLRRGHAFASGLWRYGAMIGVTHRGVGTSGLPVRFYTRGEVVVHTLRRGE
ncbi:MAG: metallophosphoesterase family protein [Nannocystaceae bacterium]|nr:metallophosphoesterase [Myxococcales bacterium]